MQKRLLLSTQWSLGLMVGLVMGFILQFGVQAPLLIDAGDLPTTESPTELTAVALTPAVINSIEPFKTLPGGWMVRVVFYRDQAPKIVRVIRLQEARLTSFLSGESHIQLLSTDGKIVYDQSFQPVFLIGDPPHSVEQVTMIFVIPVIENVKHIVVQSPNGEVYYDFP